MKASGSAAVGKGSSGANYRIPAFLLTGGKIAECLAGILLLERLLDCDIVHTDKGYNADALRRQIQAQGIMPNIPPKANRK
jgi:hypothetical protein